MDLVTEWAAKNKTEKQKDLNSLINARSLTGKTPDYTELVLAGGHWGVYASNGPNFRYAIFGRDSLVLAEDLLVTHQQLVHDIILALACLQGLKYNKVNEEEPGKIHHEYRASSFGKVVVPEHSLEILRKLQHAWGGEDTNHMIYYGSYDATPLYVRLINKYIKRYGKAILAENYRRYNGEVSTLLVSLRAAINWTVNKLEDSPFGLITYKRLNPNGIANQAWKDSATGYLNADGSLPNFDSGIASVELQGYAYDALWLSADLLADNATEAKHWTDLANKIQSNTLELLWMKEEQFFAQGLYKDNAGRKKKINTLTSNAALLLDSKILLNLPQKVRRYYVSNIAKNIFSDDFITLAGVRSRAVRHFSIPSFIDYHGSFTVWPKESNAIARGLRMHGFNRLATQLENRLLNSILMSGDFFEFYYVEEDGTIWYDRDSAMQRFDARTPKRNLPTPEMGQAWTISAVLRIISIRLRHRRLGAGSIEKHILRDLPKIDLTNIA